jgi:hypothetical protein
MKVLKAGVASLLFLVLLLGVYWFHLRYVRVDVVFYAAIADVFIAAALAALVLFGIRYFALFSGFEKTLLLVVWLLMGYSLAISVPTVIDRSLSFYILEKLQQRGGGIRQERFEEVFTKEYVKEHRLVDVRLTEQLESGTVVIENGCVKLTEKGGTIASFGRYFRAHWLPKKRLLMGQYTDDLTDPFRKSTESMDYMCR